MALRLASGVAGEWLRDAVNARLSHLGCTRCYSYTLTPAKLGTRSLASSEIVGPVYVALGVAVSSDSALGRGSRRKRKSSLE